MAEEPHLDNPAGRLHAVLERFGANRDSQIIASWNSALAVEPPKVPRALIGVADLIDDTKQAYHDTRLTMFPELPERLDAIGAMLFQPSHPMTGAVKAILPTDWDFALNDIRNLSLFLNQKGMQSRTPDDAEVAALVQTARDLIAAVTNSDALPPEWKALLIRQLTEVLTTFELWRVEGAEKVRMDVLAVATTVAAYERTVAASEPGKEPPEKVSAIFGPIKTWAAIALAAFAVVSSGAQAIGTVEHALGLLPPPAATQVDVKVELPTLEQPASPPESERGGDAAGGG